MTDKSTKNNFFKDVIKSIKDFDKYEEFALESNVKTFLYILKIVAILVLVITVMSIYQFSQNVNKIIAYFEDNIENVVYEDGKLSINNNEKIEIEDLSDVFGKIIIDTSDLNNEQIDEYKKQIQDEMSEIIILKDKAIIKNKNIAVTTETSYSELLNGYNIDKMDKQDILIYFYQNQIQMYFSVSIVLYIYMFVVYLASIFVDILLLAVVGFILSRIMKMKIRFWALFKMSAHALTLSIVLNIVYVIVNKLTGFKVQYFQTMYTAISYIYIMTVLFIIRADFIKKQIELEKIKSEQEKIHEELENEKKKEEEQKEKEKNEKEKRKQKEKEESEENDSTNVGDKPEGSNA